MASDYTSRPLSYDVILLGKTGSGKSASGNTILGKKVFLSKKTSKSVTQEVQMESVTFDQVTFNVHDTPGLFNPETSNKITLSKWQFLFQFDESARTVILLVMKADRFTPEEKETVNLTEKFIPEWLLQNTWILFTRGDELEREGLTIEEFIEDTKGLKDIVQRFQNRYHVFNNFSKSPEQVRKLINEIKRAPDITSPEVRCSPITPPEEDHLHRMMVLLGKTGAGKSATGNSILREERFRSGLSSSSITSECEIQHGVVSGRNVSVIDTPGLIDTNLSREELSVEIGRSIYLSSPGPHAFLYVQPINIRFTEQEEDVVQKLEKIFGRHMKKYTIILFTYGDQLEGNSEDMLLQENSSLRRLVNECGGRYHIFNNKQRKREQVSELLQKIDRMVEENGGTCYSNEMYKEAARIRRKKERADNEGFTEFCKNNKRALLIAAGVGFGGGTLTGAAMGAAVGGVVGGPVGAVVGAGVGAGVAAFRTVMNFYIRKTNNNQKS